MGFEHAQQGDAGSFDAGFDAARPDAFVPSSDAGPRDTGVSPADAGNDAGSADAGCTVSCGCCASIAAYGVLPTPSTCGPMSDGAQFSFEADIQSWSEIDDAGTVMNGLVSLSSTQAFSGNSSLQVMLTVPTTGAIYAYIAPPTSIPLGATLTFHVWLPPGASLSSIQPYIMDANYVWSGEWIAVEDLVFGCWNTIQVPVPSTFVTPLFQMGVQFLATAGYTGIAYIDSVSW